MANIFNSRNLLKNADIKNSKQSMMAKRLFGNRRGRHGKDFKIGKKFRSHSSKDHTLDISPSVEEYDHMMSKISGTNDKKKKSMFSKRN